MYSWFFWGGLEDPLTFLMVCYHHFQESWWGAKRGEAPWLSVNGSSPRPGFHQPNHFKAQFQRTLKTKKRGLLKMHRHFVCFKRGHRTKCQQQKWHRGFPSFQESAMGVINLSPHAYYFIYSIVSYILFCLGNWCVMEDDKKWLLR